MAPGKRLKKTDFTQLSPNRKAQNFHPFISANSINSTFRICPQEGARFPKTIFSILSFFSKKQEWNFTQEKSVNFMAIQSRDKAGVTGSYIMGTSGKFPARESTGMPIFLQGVDKMKSTKFLTVLGLAVFFLTALSLIFIGCESASTPADKEPGAPTALTATPGDGGEVILSWQAPGDTGIIGGDGTAGTITSYTVYYSTTQGFAISDTGVTAKDAGTAFTYTITGLSPEIPYYFRVTASNATGEGAPSPTATTSLPVTVDSFKITEVSKPAVSRRYHYAYFTIASADGLDLGTYKFGLKAASSPAPTAAELLAGDGIYRRVDGTYTREFLYYTLDSGIGDYISGNSVTGTIQRHGYVELGQDGNPVPGSVPVDVDKYLLSPGSSYTLYAVHEDSGEVFTFDTTFTTDPIDATTTAMGNDVFPDNEWDALNEKYFYWDTRDSLIAFGIYVTGEALLNLSTTVEQVSLASFVGSAASSSVSMGAVTPQWTLLQPSQSTDGNSTYADIGGKQTSISILCLPPKSISAANKVPHLKADVAYLSSSGLPNDTFIIYYRKDYPILISSLTVTANATDYEVSFTGDNAAEITLPAGESIPASLTVKSLTLYEGVTGLALNDSLTLTSGSTEIALTKDELEYKYTITVKTN
ncbi:MAG: hypothetical protein B0D92_01730 [Spirochaeta sp. LUC14_002_19_P3]|nr:MAG: hypothetical protein B0D92_01730 [Spirochaeta sp. LUC14_002_19_P3]